MDIKTFASKYGIPLNDESITDINKLIFDECKKIQKVDYRELLSKYINHVYKEVDTDCLGENYLRYSDFTKEEQKILKEI